MNTIKLKTYFDTFEDCYQIVNTNKYHNPFIGYDILQWLPGPCFQNISESYDCPKFEDEDYTIYFDGNNSVSLSL